MSAIAEAALPRWDLTSAFPSLDSLEFQRAFSNLQAGIRSLEKELAEAEASRSDQARCLESLLEGFNNLQKEMRTIGSFVHGFVTTDSRDELALKIQSEFDVASIPFSKIQTRFVAWLGKLPLDQILPHSEMARDHRYALEVAQTSAHHLMSPSEEALFADFSPTALSAWSKLHGTYSSQIEVEIELDGKLKSEPMSAIRSLAYDKDRKTRRAAYEAELQSWKLHEVPLAAAMNGVKGSVSTVGKKRGWDSPLDEALFAGNIDRQTLDAMMQAARESLPDFRRYMHAKARLIGVPKLAFFDLFAPVGGTGRAWSFHEAADFVSAQFHAFSQRLGDYADRSFKENWIDAESRFGKRDGAFCMWLIHDESRILMNFKPSFGSVKTLAHELGHAYHNLCLTDRTMMQRRTPMTLAETASIFCETVVQNAALETAGEQEQLLILEGALEGECQVTIDIMSRFLFEQRVFEQRAKRELTPSEFCGLMLGAQMETYGDGLDPQFMHPYMWAAKPHYYSGRSFYNFPYMYGMLFGLGLYAKYLEDADPFKDRYDDLLSSTGLADAATLASNFGFDVRHPDFWRSSFDVIRKQIDRFTGIVDGR